MHKDQLETPVAVVDLDKLSRNICEMQDAVQSYGVKLRPHIKSHKIPEIARMQIGAGAVGITVAKLGEAEIMCCEGIEDIFVAYPLIGERKMRRLEALMGRCKIRTSVEDLEAASMMSDYLKSRGLSVDVLIEVDTGFKRTGVLPGEPTLQFARDVSKLNGINIIGIYSHAGHVHTTDDRKQGIKIGTESAEEMVANADLLRGDGFNIEEISMGATPTSAETCKIKGVTEERPGNYVYYDASAVGLNVVDQERCALSVISTVVSRPARDRAVIDGGNKTFTSDTHPFAKGLGIIKGIDGVIYDWSNEEHGILRLDKPSKDIKIGDRLEIIPVHACVVSNLWDEIVGIRNDKVELAWKVNARGMVK